MTTRIILASASATRHAMLNNAAVPFTAQPARVDEEALRASLVAEGVKPRDQADALAEMKAQRVGAKMPDALVIGSDQVLSCDNRVVTKSESREDARLALTALRGRSHSLFSAAVIYENAKPVCRHVSEARLVMRDFSDDFLDRYLDRNWPAVSGSVGAYHVEGEGIRLFSSISGDYFTILGMPLLPLLNYLATRGVIDA